MSDQTPLPDNCEQAALLLERDALPGDLLSQLKQSQQAEQDTAIRLQLATQGAGIGIWDYDITADRLIWDNQMLALYGLSADQFNGHYNDWRCRVHPDDLAKAEHQVHKSLHGSGVFDSEFRVIWPDGQIRHIKAFATILKQPDGSAYRMIGTNWDITSERRTQQAFEHQAYHDTLTNLPNRQLFQNRLQQALATGCQQQTNGAVLCLDLDHFKYINDVFGHATGDRILIEVARRIQGVLQPDDTLARLGGDEFGVLLKGNSIQGFANVGDRIQQLLQAPIRIDGERFFARASIGIATFPHDGQDSETLIKHADTAMYQAKESGRATCAFYDREQSVAAAERIQLAHELQEALQHRQLEVHYQPQFELGDERTPGRIIGLEALVRWPHPRLGMVPPGKFIPIAEEIGLITELDRYVLQQAIEQARHWDLKGLLPGRISVNISLSTPSALELPTDCLALLAEHGRLISLEITESHLMQNPEATAAALNALKQFDTLISIDDFGTGYSSLSYLSRLPIDILKIDQSFIRDLDQDGSDRAIIRAVLAMAQELRLKVIAEGIENSTQHRFLQHNHCRYGQGYLVARPMPAQQAEQFLLKHSAYN
ncbi:putative bifunctional diguanylate cyclase/phosphodiesterase [Marinobacterium arenosum]|uniref:putative bifunctional diguanylate cyclase/phosphodiesterase n=1 Tax=Marinobacterium arenosum TaxID=2862496 RepID=UPI001C93FB42|nr:GGDEF domain-containing phosphodiesterase [Marinobacterium arenosum]MBY4676071.1 EAL domain-containing protein [Marinobacterium arenosum]